MNIHKNGRLAPRSREKLPRSVLEGSLSKPMLQGSGKIVARWADRFVALRCQRFTGRHITLEASVSPATVSRVLKRAGRRG